LRVLSARARLGRGLDYDEEAEVAAAHDAEQELHVDRPLRLPELTST
jgi:hypothetical protein